MRLQAGVNPLIKSSHGLWPILGLGGIIADNHNNKCREFDMQIPYSGLKNSNVLLHDNFASIVDVESPYRFRDTTAAQVVIATVRS